MTLDPDVRALLDAAAASGVPPVWEQELGQARTAYAASAQALWGPPEALHAEQDAVLDGPGGALRIRLYHPLPAGGADLRGAIVWLHGGGWVLGDLDSHGSLCRGLAARSGTIVVGVDYRLAPEHPFPAALEDAWAALRWAARAGGAAHGIDPSRLAVGGDSAGGNLAAVCALRARDAALPLRLQLLVYPATDGACDTESYRACAGGYGLTRQAMEWFWSRYAPGSLLLGSEASPLRAPSLAGAAPALVLTAEYDVLRSDGEAYADRLEADGVAVARAHWAGMHHGFLRLPGVVARAGGAVDEVAAALRAALA